MARTPGFEAVNALDPDNQPGIDGAMERAAYKAGYRSPQEFANRDPEQYSEELVHVLSQPSATIETNDDT